MRNCPNCNKEADDDALFCYVCGTKLPEKIEPEPAAEEVKFIFCTRCGYKLEGNSKFCNQCGAVVSRNMPAGENFSPVMQNEAIPVPMPAVTEQKFAPDPMNNNVKKKSKIGKILAILLAVIAIAAITVFCLFHFSILDKSDLVDKFPILEKIIGLENIENNALYFSDYNL